MMEQVLSVWNLSFGIQQLYCQIILGKCFYLSAFCGSHNSPPLSPTNNQFHAKISVFIFNQFKPPCESYLKQLSFRSCEHFSFMNSKFKEHISFQFLETQCGNLFYTLFFYGFNGISRFVISLQNGREFVPSFSWIWDRFRSSFTHYIYIVLIESFLGYLVKK